METRVVVWIPCLLHFLLIHAVHSDRREPPSIISTNRRTVYFIKGRQLHLECQAGGFPIPDVYWMKDGDTLDLTEDDRMRKDPFDNSLTIEDMQSADAGVYQCHVQNEFGISLSDKVTVVQAYVHKTSQTPPRTRKPFLGHPLKLNCNAPRSDPDPAIVWSYHFEYDYESDEDYVELSDRVTTDDLGNLYFIAVEEDDIPGDGEFICGIYNRVTGTVHHGNSFKINPRGKAPAKTAVRLMYATQSNALVLKGKTLKMKCIFGGNPLPEVTWSRSDGSMLDASRTKYSEGSYEIAIQDAWEGDAGPYTCTGRGGGKTLTRTFTVDVEAAPSWVKQPYDLLIDEEGEGQVECRGEGTPAPRATWFINGVPAAARPPSPNLIISDSKLTIKMAQVSNTMVVQCNVSNVHGYLWSDTVVRVEAEGAKIEDENEVQLKVVRGSDIRLVCPHSGRPTPSLMWFKGDQKIHPEGRFELEEGGALFVQNADISDSGFYTCIVTNKFGKDRKRFSVFVREPTVIVEAPQDMNVRNGEDATFSCLATTDIAELKNLTFTWLKDNVTLDFSNPQLRQTGGELIVSRVALADSGVYTCVVSNLIDSVSASAELMVQAPPNPPTDVQIVRCLAARAEISWQFDELSLSNYSPLKGFNIEATSAYNEGLWRKLESVGAEQRQAEVVLSPFTRYNFRVRAVNDLGVGPPSIPTLEVCETPPSRPVKNPQGVKIVPDLTNFLVVEWEYMPPTERGGPDFSYVVMISREGDSTLQTQRIEDPAQTRLQMRVDNVYQPYTVTVKAANAYGETAQQAEAVTGFSGEGVPTVSPGNFSLSTESQLPEGQAVFTWSSVDDDPQLMLGKFHGYKIRYWKAGDPDGVAMETMVPMERTSGAMVEAKVYNLPMYSSLQADVVAVNTFYSSVGSNVVNFSTPEGVPYPPSYVNVQYAGAIHFLVEWGEPEVANGILIGYKVGYQEITVTSLGEMVIVAETTRQRTFVGGLKPDTEYRIYVWALTEVGQGDPFYIEARTASLDTALAKPEISSIQSTDRTAEVEWLVLNTPNTRPAAFYFVQYRLLGQEDWSKVESVETTSFNQRVRRLHPQSTYEVRVVATDGTNNQFSSIQLVNTEMRRSDDDYDPDAPDSSGNDTSDDEDMATEDPGLATHNVVFLTDSTSNTTEAVAATTQTPTEEVFLNPTQDSGVVNASTPDATSSTPEGTTVMSSTSSTTDLAVDIDRVASTAGTEIVLSGITDDTESGDIIYIVLEDNAPLDLICAVEGSRSDRVKWFKDEEVVQTSDNTLTLNHHQVSHSRLVVLKPRDSHSGMYKCVLNNPNSKKGQFFQVTLKKEVPKESCAVVGSSSIRPLPVIGVFVLCGVFHLVRHVSRS